MPDKPKIAFFWCASCGGCEEAILDLADQVLPILEAVELVLWPVAIDYKRSHIEAMPDGSIFATFLNGAIRTSEQQEMAELLRRKSNIIVAFGSCAQLGGIPGLANLFDRDSIMRAVYCEEPTVDNGAGIFPETRHRDGVHELDLPFFYNEVRPVDQVISVDYYVPGCPPVPKIVAGAITTLLSASPPQKGSVLAPDHALCEDCPRKESKPEKVLVRDFKRPQEILIDESKCLLAQGILCMGPATRAGCEAVCVRGNMPCSGCSGPTSRVRDQGAKAISAIASIIDSSDGQEIGRIAKCVPDPIGTFYRYSLPGSLMRLRRTPRAD